ncbi:Arsenate reductase thioredoxin-coupled, LMWP family [Acinetobacter lwoffii]|nr:Arsenate reductase thioredoxin-coupled, LMWP family [Acinetobacter lwoffii]
MKFLFLCTGNSCRSILSEVLFNSRAPEGWVAYSAGSKQRWSHLFEQLKAYL